MILYRSSLPNCYHLVLVVGGWSLQKLHVFRTRLLILPVRHHRIETLPIRMKLRLAPTEYIGLVVWRLEFGFHEFLLIMRPILHVLRPLNWPAANRLLTDLLRGQSSSPQQYDLALTRPNREFDLGVWWWESGLKLWPRSGLVSTLAI